MHVTTHDQRPRRFGADRGDGRRVTLLITGVSFILLLFFYFSVNRTTEVEAAESISEKQSLVAAKMFSHEEEQVTGKVSKYFNFQSRVGEKNTLTFLDFFMALDKKTQFSEYFIELLKSSKFKAFFFECPALTIVHLAKPFEFVLTESSFLASVKMPDTLAFAEYFKQGSPQSKVAVFTNLGSDATLLAPIPEESLDSLTKYAHLALYMRRSSLEEVKELFSVVAKTILKKLKKQTSVPVWLSTSGTGIFWLHIRLDSRPKYYTYSRYTDKKYLN